MSDIRQHYVFMISRKVEKSFDVRKRLETRLHFGPILTIFFMVLNSVKTVVISLTLSVEIEN